VSLNGESYPSLAEAKKAGAPTLNIGLFFNSIVDFLLMALAVFAAVKMINRWRKSPSPTTMPCPFCKSSISLDASRCPHCTSQLKGATV
jgi:large conductance mechanosensitive channel